MPRRGAANPNQGISISAGRCEKIWPMVAIERILVFDDQRQWAAYRRDKVAEAVRQLDEAGLVEKIPQIDDVSNRNECLNLATAGQRVLLVADMHSERNPWRGNIGARLLRAIATNAVDDVWRVLWTMYDHPTVISDMVPYVNSFVFYDPTDDSRLADGIRHALSGKPGEVPCRPFVQDLDVQARHRLWNERITELLIPGEPLKENDRLAAAGVLSARPDTVTNQMLAKAYKDATDLDRRHICPNVDDLLTRIAAHDKAHARERLQEALGPLSQERASDLVVPWVIDTADRQRGPSYRRTRRTTGLKEEEDELARVFIDVYKRLRDGAPNGKRLHASSETRKCMLVDEAIQDDDVQEQMQSGGLAEEDLSYALWTFVDTAPY